MPTPPPSALAPVRRLLGVADRAFHRLYGWRLNPLYQSGTLVVALWLVLLITGLWLLLFYRIGEPWGSVARLTADPWTGNWVRGLHRYASDAAVVATLLHALRMLVQHRSWGPRTLAWVSGCALLFVVLLSGWTGFVMVWDDFGLALADEGARILEAVPLLSEPIRRAFTGERPVPDAFFFLNLFLHVALPLGLGLIFWLHVSRLARPALLPPRPLLWGSIAVLTIVAVAWPIGMAPEANPFRHPERIELSWVYGFWLPVTRELPPGVVWMLVAFLGGFAVILPWLTRPSETPPPSVVHEPLCTGCSQCALDCPYEAITMLERTDGRAEFVARVNPALCVSCGICTASCAPMGVGPAGRDGRDQLAIVRGFIASPERTPGEVTVVACAQAADGLERVIRAEGAAWMPVDCVGNLHTSSVEFLVRSGAGGVLILSCPDRDCWNREGPRWLEERLYHGREAELQDRVDRRRIAVERIPAGDGRAALAALARFRASLRDVAPATAERDVVIDTECEPATVVVGDRQ
jgi:quinol-cytochrome oxidoreductase complex cytochrome b subunit/coenzyme F420-reducing hydrogenase delta subunit